MAGPTDFLNNLPTFDQVIGGGITPPAPPPGNAAPSGNGNFITAALGSGFHQGLGDLGGAAQAVTKAVGLDSLAQSSADFAARQRDIAATYARPDLESNPWSLEGVAYKALQGLPAFGAMLGGGALATLGAAGPDEAIAALGPAAAALAARQAATNVALRGAVGTGLAAYPFSVGSNVDQAREEGQPITQGSAAKALALGVPEAALQSILPVKAEGAIAHGVEGFASKGFGRKVLAGAATGAAIQMPVGVATAALTAQMGDPNRTLASRSQDLVNAALMGGVQGGLFGGLTHAFAKRNPADITDQDMNEMVDQPIAGLLPAPAPMEGSSTPAPEPVGGPPAPSGLIDTQYKLPTPPIAMPDQTRPFAGLTDQELLQEGARLMKFNQDPDRLQGIMDEYRTRQIEQQSNPSNPNAVPQLPDPRHFPPSPNAEIEGANQRVPASGETIPLPDQHVYQGETVDNTPPQLEAPYTPGVDVGSGETIPMGQVHQGELVDTTPKQLEAPFQPGVDVRSGETIPLPDQRPPDPRTPDQIMDVIRDTAGVKRIPAILKEHLGDENALKAAIVNTINDKDEANTPYGDNHPVMKIARAFGVVDKDGEFIQPSQDVGGKATPDAAPAQSVATPNPITETPAAPVSTVPDRSAVPEAHQAKFDRLQTLREQLEQNPNLAHLLPQVDALQTMTLKPKSGEPGKIVAGTNKLEALVKSANDEARVAQITGKELPTREATPAAEEKPAQAPSPQAEAAVAKIKAKRQPKVKTDAVQERSAAAVDVREQSTDGETVRAGDTPAQKAAREVQASRRTQDQGAPRQAQDLGPVKQALMNARGTLGALIEKGKMVGKTEKSVATKDAALQAQLDKRDQLLQVVAKAVKSGDVSQIKDDHFGDALTDKHYDSASSATQKMIDAHDAAEGKVIDEVKRARGEQPSIRTPASETPTQADVDLTHIVDNGGTLKDVLAHMRANGSNGAVKTLAAILERSGVDADVHFASPDEAEVNSDRLQDPSQKLYGGFKASANRVNVYDKSGMEQTMLHEATHAATDRGLNAGGEAATEMRGLFDQVKKASPGNDAYGMDNVHEFVAEAYSNPTFREFLKSLPDKSGSLWQRFKDTVSRMLGMSGAARTMLDRVMETGDRLMQDRGGINGADTAERPSIRSAPGSARDSEEKLKGGMNAASTFAERTINNLRSGKLSNLGPFARETILGWMNIPAIRDQYERLIPALRQHWDNLKRLKDYENSLNKGASYATHLRKSLSPEVQKLLNGLMTYTNLGIDPRRTWDQHTWLHGETNAKELAAQVRQANIEWNNMKRMEGGKGALAYEAMHNTGQSHLHAYITNMLLGTLKRDYGDKVAIDPNHDPFDLFNKSNAQQDPKTAAAFWKAQSYSTLKLARDYVNKVRGDIAKAATPAESAALQEHIALLHSAVSDASRLYTAADQAPNFPLRRRGNWFVSGKMVEGFTPAHVKQFQEALQKGGFKDVTLQSNAESNHVFIRVETQQQAQNLRNIFEQMKASKVLDGGEDITSGLTSQLANRNGIAPQWLSRAIKAMQDNFPTLPEGASDALTQQYETARQEALRQMTNQWLDILPESSMSKMFAKREGVQGFSGDMGQAFDQRSYGSARGLAGLAMSDKMASTQSDMMDQLRAVKKGKFSVADQTAAQQATGEILLREAQRQWQVASPVIDSIRHLTHVFELGLSPAYSLTMMTQLPTLGLPQLGKVHGYAKSALAIAKATPEALNVLRVAVKTANYKGFMLDPKALKAAGIKDSTIEFLRQLDNRGTFSHSYTNQMMEGNRPQGPIQPFYDVSEAWTINSEMAPRLIMALAAKDLHEQNAKLPPTTQKALGDVHDYAREAVDRSQFEWVASGNPRQVGRHGMFGAASPLVNQFMGFHIKLMEKLHRETADAIGGGDPVRTAQARKWMLGHLAAVTALSGTMGLPMVSWFAGAYDRLADWATGDDSHDIRASYRNFLSDTFGKDMGEVLARGAPRSLGMDLSHEGEDRILPFTQLISDKRKMEDAWGDWVKSMAGSAAGMGLRTATGIRDMTNGDYLEGMSKVLPEQFRMMAEAGMLAKYGYTDKNGFPLQQQPSQWDTIQKIMGLEPGSESELSEVKRVGAGLEERRQYDEQNIMRHLSLAFNRGDQESRQQWLQSSSDYSRNNPGLMPPAAGFGQFIEQHLKEAAMARALGAAPGMKPNDVIGRGMVRFGNFNGQ